MHSGGWRSTFSAPAIFRLYSGPTTMSPKSGTFCPNTRIFSITSFTKTPGAKRRHSGPDLAQCGRGVFLAHEGFDCEKFTVPSIEDIDLGFRLRTKGEEIILDRDIQGKHLKRWDVRSHLRTEIFCRALPWSRLILENKGLINDMNLKTSDRIERRARRTGPGGPLPYRFCGLNSSFSRSCRCLPSHTLTGKYSVSLRESVGSSSPPSPFPGNVFISSTAGVPSFIVGLRTF